MNEAMSRYMNARQNLEGLKLSTSQVEYDLRRLGEILEASEMAAEKAVDCQSQSEVSQFERLRTLFDEMGIEHDDREEIMPDRRKAIELTNPVRKTVLFIFHFDGRFRFYKIWDLLPQEQNVGQ